MTRSHMHRINISERRVANDVEQAWDTGKTENASTRIVFDGTHRELWSFRGRRRFVTGQMCFWHYQSKVMSVDFDRDLVTDHGFTGYSPTTSAYLRVWLALLQQAGVWHAVSLSVDFRPFNWTCTEKQVRGAGYHKDMWERFRAGAPWVRKHDGAWWFHGPSYQQTLVGLYEASRQDVLKDGVSWRWFTYDWDAEGRWSKRFIDANAERRWNKRQTKKAA
jgi:hypothetical protein